MYGDLSAGSGLNALTRDEDFTRDFLTRHQDKLLYGSDCSDHRGRRAHVPGRADDRRHSPAGGEPGTSSGSCCSRTRRDCFGSLLLPEGAHGIDPRRAQRRHAGGDEADGDDGRGRWPQTSAGRAAGRRRGCCAAIVRPPPRRRDRTRRQRARLSARRTTTSRNVRSASAPSAMRTPISAVRRVTE